MMTLAEYVPDTDRRDDHETGATGPSAREPAAAC